MTPWRWEDWQLAHPVLLGVALLLVVVWGLRRLRGGRAVVLPFLSRWVRPSVLRRSGWPFALASLSFLVLVVALARPQKVEDKHQRQVEGYDIVLVIDLSKSMLEEDYQIGGATVNRLQAVKPVIEAFINRRSNDRIGMVVFGDVAYTLAPLTFDHAWLRRQTERLYAGVAGDNTAIGDGLGVALSRLDQASRSEGGKRQGAFIVLLTDGENNRGALQPMQSAQVASQRGIPIYAIGAGSERRLFGIGPTLPNAIDEDTLRQIAAATGGSYFRASDTQAVQQAFAAIDQAQKIEFQATSYLLTEEHFTWWLMAGLTGGVFSLCGLWSQQRTEVAA
ncbi:MAG: VWA domain-containing protein [Candidatus Methylacidiphilales bacterium]